MPKPRNRLAFFLTAFTEATDALQDRESGEGDFGREVIRTHRLDMRRVSAQVRSAILNQFSC
jgi:hypothetical protein